MDIGGNQKLGCDDDGVRRGLTSERGRNLSDPQTAALPSVDYNDRALDVRLRRRPVARDSNRQETMSSRAFNAEPALRYDLYRRSYLRWDSRMDLSRQEQSDDAEAGD
ncbi:MAG: hypothetical protein ACJ8G1_11765 [Vitreoscilla sp.]